MPPQDLEAEASLLGAMLLDKESIGLVLRIISREEGHRFYRRDHRLLFETLIDLYDQNQPIDIILLEDELRRRNLLEEVNGREYLLELVNSVASVANAEHYAHVVRDKGMLRDLIRATGDIMQSAFDDNAPAQQILDQAERELFQVTEQRISNQAVSVREFLDATFEQLSSEEDLLTGIPTGFTELDAMTGGLQPGDLIVIAARPSMGKTALGLSMLEHIGIDEDRGRGLPAVFFSMEMSKLLIAQRLLCSRARVDMSKLRHRRLGSSEIAQLQLAADQMRDSPIFIDDTPGMSIMEVRAKSRRLKMMHDVRVIFVDYMQLMYDPAGRENRQQEIAAISRGLKALGRELNTPIVALAQLNRQVEGRSSNRPKMSDLRESGAIEQDADVVILLHREEYYLDKQKNKEERLSEVQGKAELIIDKQRNGPTGVVTLHFSPQYTRFDNASAEYIRDTGEFADEGFVSASAYVDRPAPAAEDADAPF
ncbi:MAG: replicative DNA helicase [Phycisphaerae bacterium]